MYVLVKYQCGTGSDRQAVMDTDRQRQAVMGSDKLRQAVTGRDGQRRVVMGRDGQRQEDPRGLLTSQAHLLVNSSQGETLSHTKASKQRWTSDLYTQCHKAHHPTQCCFSSW